VAAAVQGSGQFATWAAMRGTAQEAAPCLNLQQGPRIRHRQITSD